MAMHKKINKRKSIQNSDPGKILDLVMNLNDDSCSQLQIKINIYLREECDAETIFLIIVHGDGSEASIEAIGSTSLSRKHKICMTQKLSDILKSTVEQTELLSNLEEDLQAIVSPYLTKEVKKRIIMFPLADKPFSTIVCAVAPKVPEEQVALIIHECFLFCWPVLKKTIALEHECTLKQKCQQLLRVARRLFTQVASLDTLLQIAMEQAKQLTKAEYCSVFLIDVDSMELVKKCYPPANTQNVDENEIRERRYPLNTGITGQVIKTGTLINCKNAKQHPAYNSDIDCFPEVDCKSILCFPIHEQTGIIGVGQLINKIGDPYFDVMDEETALAFSIYCGICIMHSVVYQKIEEAHIRNALANELVMYHMKVYVHFDVMDEETALAFSIYCGICIMHSVVYQKIEEAHIRNALANELVMYHMKVGDSEVSRVLECTGFHDHPHITSLHFNLRALPPRELPCYVFKMFSDLGFDKKFNINKQKLVRFILHVKKGYRDVPYHSWLHAFSVAQWAFAAITHYKLVAKGYFTDLQALMYLIACLVHDMDHRGTTNSFQIQGQTTLAALYSSEGSVMERHHLAQAACVLNAAGCDVLAALTRRDYDRAILLLRDYILATDLANYFKNLNEYKAISYDFQKGNRAHTSALQCLMMNAADLSDQLKDWGSVKKTAAAVLTEFFKQGDEEKSRGDLPASIMDREKCFIPDLEIQFLNTTCIPLFEVISRILPKAQPCLKIIENHIEKWEAAKSVFAEVPITAGLSVLLSPELDNLIEQNLKEKERLKLEGEAEGEKES